jgi:hypothetical protein
MNSPSPIPPPNPTIPALAQRLLLIAVIGLASIGAVCGQPQVVSDFSSANWDFTYDQGIAQYRAIDGQLVITGNLPPATSLLSTFTLVSWNRSLGLQDSETLELRVDLVEADEEDVQTLIQWKDSNAGGYAVAKDRDEIWLTKFRQVADGANAPFFYEPLAIKSRNVTLALALTRLGSSVVLRVAILDPEANDAVLFQKTVTDTPGVDPTVASFRGYTFYPDPGPAWLNANAVDLAVLSLSSQRESDFRLVLDNLTYTRSDIPTLSVERAVQLSWPAVGGSWIVEGASDVEGPWSLVTEPVTQNGSMQQMTVPARLAEGLGVFRLRQAD